jgi:hypothetical protein
MKPIRYFVGFTTLWYLRYEQKLPRTFPLIP